MLYWKNSLKETVGFQLRKPLHNTVESKLHLRKLSFSYFQKTANFRLITLRSTRTEMLSNKAAFKTLSKLTEKHLCQSLFFNQVSELINLHFVFCLSQCYIHKTWNFIKKGTLTQVFSCDFCIISKKNFLNRTYLVASAN